MSKLNQIEKTLLELEGGKFQKLCDTYIYALGYGKVCSFGSVEGSDKTEKGTPDSYIKTDDGKFIFIEYTTQQTNVYKKFNQDLDKCFDEKKTGIPVKNISKIIICYNSKLSPGELYALNVKCKANGCLLEEFDLSSLAFGLLHKFPYIAKEFLGIEVDTGQILPPSEFIKQKTAFSTPLDNEFMFREDELDYIIKQLNISNLVILSGKPGVGKTKLALEAMYRFAEINKDYKIYCIENKNLPIYDDLKAYFSQNLHALVLVDDANRISQLHNILDLITNNEKERSIKLILTVRDYALRDIKNIVYGIPHVVKEIEPLERSKIAKILESKDIGITNQTYQDRICSIAKGNPRLALMAAKVALETQDLHQLSDASKIYNAFFHKLLLDIKQLRDKDLLKVLAIIAYFRILDIKCEVCNHIYSVFGISEAEFWDRVILLSELEIVDLYEKQVCKIVDQIQATFFFFRIVFKDKIIPFSAFLDNFFFGFQKKMRDTIIPIVNTFDFSYIEQNIKSSVDKLWEMEQEEDKLLTLADTFWFVRRTETLNYLYERIKNAPNEELDFDFTKKVDGIKDRYLSILEYFVHSSEEEFKISLELIFLYLEKCPSLLPQVLYYIKSSIGYDITSYQRGYHLQIIFFNFILNKAQNNSLYVEILFKIGPGFLKIKQECYRSDGKEVTFITFNLVLTSELEKLRSLIFKFIIENGNDSQFRVFMKTYVESLKYDAYKNILEFDSKILLPYLREKFSPNTYSNCRIVQDYIDILAKHELFSDLINEIRQLFINKTFEISKVLLPDVHERIRLRKEENLSWDEIRNLREKELAQFFSNYSLEDYKLLMTQVEEILEYEDDHDKYQCKEALISVIEKLIDKDINLFFEILKHIVLTNNNVDIDLNRISKKLFLNFSQNHETFYNMITKHEYKQKDQWILSFFRYLQDDLVDANYLSKFLSFIENLKVGISLDFDFLVKFESLDPGIHVKIAGLLFNQCNEKKHSFHLLFNPYSDVSKKLVSIFKDNVDLLKQIYFYQCSNFSVGDYYDGNVMKQILILDSGFLIEYLNWKFKSNKYISDMTDHRNYNFIWQLDNYKNILNEIIDFFIKNDNKYYVDHHYINVFFRYDSDSLKDKIIKFIESYISKNSNDIDKIRIIFIPIRNLYKENLTKFLKIFLSKNTNFNDFKKINFEKNFYLSDGGSFITAFERELTLWESILPLLDSVDLMEHRLYVKQKIERQRKRIETEKRRDFIGLDH